MASMFQTVFLKIQNVTLWLVFPNPVTYAHEKTNGQIIYDGDVVMLYYIADGRFVSIQGQNEADDTSLNFCPGVVPPAYLSYGICSKNAFRICRKP